MWASCRITDAPGWLRKYGGCSFEYRILDRRDMRTWTRVCSAAVSEVSLLSPTVKPAEPLARVEWVGSSAARGSSDRACAVIDHGPGGAPVVRHGIGQVLGVR
jgi:hypothetical protein